MFEIRNEEISSDVAKQLHSLLAEEWSDLENFEAEKYGKKIPDPIVVIKNSILVGGLAFTSYKEPNTKDIVIWVNALFVIPEMRKQGIARHLIQASQKYASCLYALTDIPSLYTNLGWQKVKTDNNGTIVKYARNT